MSDDPRVEIRAASAAPTVQDGGARPRLAGHFARFNTFNEIDSVTEGRFLERIEPGAFARTFKNNGNRIRMLFQHGRDPQIGDKPIGDPEVLREDRVGPYFEGDLFESVPPLIVDGLRAGQYGISYRFAVVNEDWNRPDVATDYNPLRLPERTIREARVFEFGPVTFPADPGADYSVRAITLTDLDAALAPPEQTPALPDAGPEAEPHSDEGTREVVTPTIEQEPTKEIAPVETPKYFSLDEMGARVRELDAEIKRAAELPGVLPEREQAEFDEKVAERAALDHAMTAWRNRLAQVREAPPEMQEPTYSPVASIVRKTETDIYDPEQLSGIHYRTEQARSQTVRDNALRAIDQARLPKSAETDNLVRFLDTKDTDDESGTPEIARRIILTGSPIYKRAFAKYLQQGNTLTFTPEEQRAAALAVTGTTTTGGYAVPYVFDPTMIHIGAYTAINPFRQACRVETISAGNNWKTVTVGAVTSAYVTEAAAATEQGPTFGQPDYTVQRAHAFATLSIETLQDRPDITEELTSVFAESKATYEENQFAVGAGSTVFPLGMFTDTAYTNQDTATNDVTAIADILVLEGILPLRYRANAAFFMNRKTIRQLQALDTTYRYFSGAGIQFAGQLSPTQPPTTGNTGLQLLGYPVWEVPSAVSTLTTDGAIIVVFADPRSYVIVDRIGMNVEVIANMLNGATPSFPTGQRGVYCYWRNTAKPLAADMGRSLSVQ